MEKATSPDELFGWILIAGFAIVMPIGLYFRLRSNASGEFLDRGQEGRFILLTLRPIALASIFATFAFVIQPSWMTWSQVPLPTAVRWCGVPLGIAAAALLVWVFRSIGSNITDTVVTRKDHQLITHGPYRLVRHPLYTMALFAAIANSLVTANAFIFATGVAAFVLLMIRSKTEEKFLVAYFGDDYREYRRKTGSVFPKIFGNGCCAL